MAHVSFLQYLYIFVILFILTVLHLYITVTSISDHDEDKEEVRVVIVDQHQEVIPYWYKAAEDGLVAKTKNTLIHIDAHSDMAPPDDYNPLKKFKPFIEPTLNNFLPMMQYNDAFITSAIVHGFINHVIWVTPSWTKSSLSSMLLKSYIGLTPKHVFCYCQIQIRSKPDKNSENYDCYSVKRTNGQSFAIEQSSCHLLSSYLLVVCNEHNYAKYINLNTVNDVFIDIDEDYFGVESGVQQFLDMGLNLNVISEMNVILAGLFCPVSNENEAMLNAEIKKLFLNFSRSIHENEDETRLPIKYVKHMLEFITANNTCNKFKSFYIQQAADLISSLDVTIILALSKVSYCNSNSLRLKAHGNEFMLCHGSISATQTINELHVSNKSSLLLRGKQLEQILHYIYKTNIPRFISIGRSLRDGYVPRMQQRTIEAILLNSLNNVFRVHKKTMNLIYDEFLLFGKEGWK